MGGLQKKKVRNGDGGLSDFDIQSHVNIATVSSSAKVVATVCFPFSSGVCEEQSNGPAITNQCLR